MLMSGESVPVSKTVIVNEAVAKFDPYLHDLPPFIAKHFLFSGTKIVRARPGSLTWGGKDEVTVAVAARIGFNTTKGALIRSMLFPRPNKFKFYQDSFKFIGVLGIIGIFSL